MPIKVLVIDDDPEMTQLVKLLLREKSFEVYTENSGTEGIEAVRKIEPDIIVLDLMMPELDGWAVCQKIRTFSQIPILVLSVVVEINQLERSIDAGANSYLTKPVTRKTLISQLEKLVNSSYNEGLPTVAPI